jgi:cell wall-associated NlpC family hydrolase
MGWSPEQIQNAATIYQVGRSMGMSTRDIQIGLMAAIVESGLKNVNYGDRDSLGLFQQRPSAGWGQPEQILNPRYAAQKFFSALRGLGDRRNQMSMGSAAQAVQRSAYPGRYDQHIGDVRALWPRVTGAAGDPQQSMDGGPYTAQPSLHFSADKQTSSTMPDQQPDYFGSADDALGLPSASILDAWDSASPLPPQDSNNTDAALTSAKSYMPLVSQGTNQAVIQPMAEETGGYAKGVSGWRKAAVQTALRYVGTPYVWGGSTPSGFDCSGLVQYALGQAGKRVPRISYQQANMGKRVGLNQLRPGDLVAWDNSTRNNGADHIAIYIGNGKIVEAPRPGLAVRVRSLGSNEGAFGVSLG